MQGYSSHLPPGYDRGMNYTPRAQRLLFRVITLAVVNSFSFYAVTLCLGGDALNGKSGKGIYYLGSYGKTIAVEVSRGVYVYSQIHAISAVIAYAVIFITYGCLCYTGDIRLKPPRWPPYRH